MLSRPPAGMALPSLVRRFARDSRGDVNFVEAAFIFPLLILMYCGTVAVTMGVTTDRKLTMVARSLGDIAAQDTNITAAEMDDTFNAVRAVMAPYNSDPTIMRARVSSLKIKADGKACVEWSSARPGGFARTPGAIVTGVPADLKTPNTWLIMSEGEYHYTPVIGDDITGGPIELSDTFYMRPRQSAQVTWDGQPATSPCT
jgi:Flp pilus assembly protein TadG